MRTIKSLVRKSAFVCCLSLATASWATTYYSKARTAGTVRSSVTWCLDADCTQVADVQPTPADGDGNVYVFLSAEKWSADTVPGKCYLGCDGTTVGSAAKDFGAFANHGEYLFSDLTLMGGQIQLNDKSYFTLGGSVTLPAGRSFTLQSYNNGAEGEERCFRIGSSSSVFVSAADSTLNFKTHFYPGTSSSKRLAPVFEVAGDMSGFKGVLSVADLTLDGADVYARIKMTSASAFGDTSVAKSGAIRLGKNSYLEVESSVLQSASRGITLGLTSTGRAGVMAASGKSWTLTAPVSGTTGTFVKRGAGTVTLDGPIEMPNIEVMEGKAVFGANATYAASPRILVRAGASVAFEKFVPGATITYEAGALADPLVVPYDAANKTTTPIAYTSAQASEAIAAMGGQIALSLSASISMPDGEARRLALMTIDGGTLTAEAFRDATPKNWGLPRTSIEVETNGSGVQTVFLVTRPSFSYTGTNSNKSIDQSANWSPSGEPKSSGDYYMNVTGSGIARTGSGSQISSFSFAGGSLSLTKTGAEIYDYAESFSFTELRLFAGTKISSLQSYNKSCILNGTIYVDSSSTGSAKSVIDMPGSKQCEMRTTLTGSGDLQLSTSPGNNPLEMTGMSPDFAGGIFFSQGTDGQRTVTATNGLAFGGPLPEFRADAVSFVPGGDMDKAFTFRAEESLAIDAANRGWTVKNTVFDVAEGKTLVFRPAKLTATGSLYKAGAGTLVIGSPVEGGATLSVEEGLLQAADSTCTAGTSMTFASGAGFRVVAGNDEAPQGLAAESLAPAAGAAKINVVVDLPAEAVAARRNVTVPICSVPAGHADLTDVLSPAHIRFYSLVVKSETVADRTVYSATCMPAGIIIILR